MYSIAVCLLFTSTNRQSAAFTPTQWTSPASLRLRHSTLHMSEFNEATYESDRLAKDALAMEAMKQEAENEYSKLRTPWKWRIRKAVWDYLEDNNIAQFPR